MARSVWNNTEFFKAEEWIQLKVGFENFNGHFDIFYCSENGSLLEATLTDRIQGNHNAS